MIAQLIIVSAFAVHPEAQAAFADKAYNPNSVYLSLCEVPREHRERLEKVLRFVVPSLSSKSYLGDQLPVRVAGTNLLRIDLAGLGWEKQWSSIIAKHYVPLYRQDLKGSGKVPLIVSGAWFVATMTDSNLSGDSQYLLLYNGVPPKSIAEFEKFWQVNNKRDLFFGRIEGDSGVSVQKTRLIENRPTGNRGYSWITFDSRVVAGETDPLENLTSRSIKHDASELIAAIPKHYRNRAGSLQAYMLANAKGERLEKAPADIVIDKTEIRGVEIRNTISCIACHIEGLRIPTLDVYQQFVTSGAEVRFLKKADQFEVDRFYDSPIVKELQRNNQDYAEAVDLCNGLTPQTNAIYFKQVVQAYDALVTIEQAARELYADAQQLRYAIASYPYPTGRAVTLTKQAITRDQFASNYYLLQQMLYHWQLEFDGVLK